MKLNGMYRFFQAQNDFERKVFTFLVVFMMLGNVYRFPGFSQLGLGEVLFLFFIPLYCRKNLDVSVNRFFLGFFIYLGYLALVSLFMLNNFNAPMDKLFSLARVAFYWILIFCFGKNLFRFDYFKKFLSFFTIALSCFILVQTITFALTNYYIPGFIPGLPLNQSAADTFETIQHTLESAYYLGFIRPSGFLLEPSHCVQALFVGLALFMNDEFLDEKKKIIFILIVSFAILATMSTTGIVVLIFSCFFYFFDEKKSIGTKLLIVLALLCCLLLMMSGSINIDNWAVDRFLNIVNKSEIDASSEMRLNNGVLIMENFPFLWKLFGTGMGMFDYVVMDLGLSNAVNYMNTLSFILFSAGYVGMFLWVVSLFIFLLYSNRLGKCLTIGFFILTTGCSIFCQPVMVWIFLVVMSNMRKNND